MTPGRVDSVVRAMMRTLDDMPGAAAARNLDGPGFHGPVHRGSHSTWDGNSLLDPPRGRDLGEGRLHRAVEQAMQGSAERVDWRTSQPANDFHGSLDPRSFFGI